MNGGRASRSGRVDRRTFLAAGATGIAASASGCVGRVGSVVGGPERQLSLSITTVPDDDDRQTIELVRVLARNLEAVGVDVSIDLRTTSEFLRSILLDRQFDLYVGRCPRRGDPDYLYELLHSRFATEAGWQNPFGYVDMQVDELLEAQRVRDGDGRREVVADLLRAIVDEKPFVPICVPDEYRVVRSDRFDGWHEDDLTTRRGYLGLEAPADTDELTGIVTDARPTRNLNPFAVHYRDRGTVVDLLYDSLAAVDGDELVPRLADTWEWDGRTLRISLRPDCRFHDGEPLTAADVAFTYRLLQDASLGAADAPVPPTRYRAEGAAIEDVSRDERTCTIAVNTGRAVGERLLTIPILPEHVWDEVIAEAIDDGDAVDRAVRRVLVSSDVPPIGSGPFAFDDRSEGDRLVLRRFEDHFTLDDDGLPAATVDEVRLLVDPRSVSAVQQVDAGRADVTVSTLETHVVDDAGGEDVDLLGSPPGSFYHVGFNVRAPPLSNPRFRRVVAGLLDPERLVAEVFDGHATPTVTPVGDAWVPPDLEWDGADPVAPFLGDYGDLDVEAAREAIDRIGLRYDADGRIVVNN